mmetsp:Transcript_21213/g.47840  ORF Transcript_21213/g.47840 Transcript_21213/m.47840 type:complete len:299 (-) Transcript_21213:187-1083(-)
MSSRWLEAVLGPVRLRCRPRRRYSRDHRAMPVLSIPLFPSFSMHSSWKLITSFDPLRQVVDELELRGIAGLDRESSRRLLLEVWSRLVHKPQEHVTKLHLHCEGIDIDHVFRLAMEFAEGSGRLLSTPLGLLLVQPWRFGLKFCLVAKLMICRSGTSGRGSSSVLHVNSEIADVALQRFPSLISKTFANIAVTDPLQPLLGCLSHVQRMAFVHGDLRWIRGNRLSLLAHLLVQIRERLSVRCVLQRSPARRQWSPPCRFLLCRHLSRSHIISFLPNFTILCRMLSPPRSHRLFIGVLR